MGDASTRFPLSHLKIDNCEQELNDNWKASELAGRIASNMPRVQEITDQGEYADSPLARIKVDPRWLCIFILTASLIGGSRACGADQVKLGTSINYKCVRCAECPHGTEPSIPCGSQGQVLECKPCKAGTFSSAYGKHKCDPCTICGDKRVILQKCTAKSNSVCGPCRAGHYHRELVADCFECSPCCGDGKDVRPHECRNIQGKQCEKRHSSCPAPSPLVTQVPPVTPTPTPTAPLPTSEPTSHSTNPLEERRLGTDEPTEISKTAVIVGTTIPVLVSCVIIAVIVYYKGRNSSQSSRDEESGYSEDTEPTDVNKSTESVLQSPLGAMKLTSFADNHFAAFEKVCEALDTERPGCGHYEHVAKQYHVETNTIKSRFEKHSEGPSKALFSWLGGERPDLTVGDFMVVLKSQAISRNDVVAKFSLP